MAKFQHVRRWSGAILVVVLIVLMIWLLSRNDAIESIQSLPRASISVGEAAGPALTTSNANEVGPMSSDSPETAESQSVREQNDHANWVRAIVAELIRLGDAESLVGASLLMYSNAAYFAELGEKRGAYFQRYLDLLKRAASLADSDSNIQWLALTFCQDAVAKGVECDPSAYGNALRTHDPDNATSWLSALGRSTAMLDQEGQALALERMSNAKRFDDHDAGIEALVSRAIESARVTPPKPRFESTLRPIDALAAGAVRNLPGAASIAPIIKVCTPSAAGALIANCRRLANLMRASGSYELVESGLAISQALVPPGSSEARQIAETQRRLEWQMERTIGLYAAGRQQIPRTQVIGDLRDMETLLRNNGISLEPPPDWKRR